MGRDVARPRKNWVLWDLEDGRSCEWRRWYLPYAPLKVSGSPTMQYMAPWNSSLDFLAFEPRHPRWGRLECQRLLPGSYAPQITEDHSRHWHWEIRKRRASNRPGVRARPRPISESPRIPVLYSREVVVVVGVPITTVFGWFPRQGGGATKLGII